MSGIDHRPNLAWVALAAAALFAASTPLAKLVLGQGVDPWLLAGLLYLGSGLGLGALRLAGILGRRTVAEAPLRRADIPTMALVVMTGGIAGPVLLMLGLSTTPASTTSLLLNLEGVATLAIAWLWFRESVDRRLLTGAAAIFGGAVLLSWQGATGIGPGAVAIAAACLAWGIDNNLTRKLSAANPVQIAMVKGLAAGTVNMAIALFLGAGLPSFPVAAAAGAIGFLGYGISLVFFVLSLRHLGAARTGAYFATAPFLGALLAVALLAEPLSVPLIAAGAAMAVGVWLHLTERHEHEHRHEAMAHEHRHVHDEHHRHEHLPGDPPGEPHSHPHRHAPLVHRHRHFPDLHHGHPH